MDNTQSNMNALPPPVRTAVATAVDCEAGRRITHPTRSGWDEPCTSDGTEEFPVSEKDGSTSVLMLCRWHFHQLAADGLAF